MSGLILPVTAHLMQKANGNGIRMPQKPVNVSLTNRLRSEEKGWNSDAKYFGKTN